MKNRGIYFGIGMLIIVSILLGGCKTEQVSVKKIKDLEFTVVEDADLPEELKELIEEKKKEAFKLSFATGDYLYIVRGYGTQATGGYSITVNSLYETENAVYINTTLIGPDKKEKMEKAESYPYIVIKTEFLDRNVVYE